MISGSREQFEALFNGLLMFCVVFPNLQAGFLNAMANRKQSGLLRLMISGGFLDWNRFKQSGPKVS
jgi:hypothetical protein